jgi:predicted  nucleic acid-binding Zn-ribbon protein
MSIQQSEVQDRVGRNKRDQGSAAGIDESGRSIVALLGRAADSAKDECARALDLAHRLTFQLRAAEERAQDAEERVQALETEVAHFRDRALRAEDWLRHIHTEVEQAFFRKNGSGPSQLPRTNGAKHTAS